MPSKKNKRTWLLGAKIAISVLIFTLLLHGSDLSALHATLSTALPQWIMAGVAVFAAGQVLAAFRWQTILRSGKVRISTFRAVRLNFIGSFISNFMPGMAGGDLIRPLYLTVHYPNAKTFLYSSVLFDRICGVLAILGIGTLAALTLGISQHNWRYFLLFSCAAAGAAVFLMFIARIRQRDTEVGGVRRILGLLSNMLATVAVLLKQPYLMLTSMFLSIVFQLTWLAMLWMMLTAVGAETGPAPLLIAGPISLLAAMLPVSLNGLGIREGTFALMLAQFGIPLASSAAASLLALLPLLFASLLGAIFFFAEPIRPTEAPE